MLGSTQFWLFIMEIKNLEKVSESIKATTISGEDDELTKMTVEEVFEKMPEYKTVTKAKVEAILSSSTVVMFYEKPMSVGLSIPDSCENVNMRR